MEYNDPCKMCIEDNYSANMDILLTMTIQIFESISLELSSSRAFVYTEADRNSILDLAKKTKHLAASLTKADIEDWYFYYSTRLLYSEIGQGWFLSLSIVIVIASSCSSTHAPLLILLSRLLHSNV